MNSVLYSWRSRVNVNNERRKIIMKRKKQKIKPFERIGEKIALVDDPVCRDKIFFFPKGKFGASRRPVLACKLAFICNPFKLRVGLMVMKDRAVLQERLENSWKCKKN